MRMGFSISIKGLSVQSGNHSWDFYLDHAVLLKIIDEVLEILRKSKIEEYAFRVSKSSECV